ncbi:MAG TPA: hypothetical protein VE077_19870, partial [Candidatus Methylomirabilis sp.]|nr:hypothetical protein [Candidatus Methylomirabilis sp.]
MSRARLVVSILLVASCSICAPVVRAQLPQASDTTSPPTPGVGHDYLGGALDTVNPANGSVSIRIPLRVSAGRRLTIPLSIAYDSSGAFYYGLPSGGSGSPGYMTITNVPFSQGGWSYTFPLLTNASETWMQQYSNGKNYTCVETANYVLQDATGNRHNMGLVGLKTPVGGNCGSAITTGGEGPILATLSGTSLLTTSVTDGNGTAYAFPAVGYHANYLVPTSITDRNGNTVSISSTLSSASVTDTVGRSAVSVGTFGANPDSINVAGLGSPYQVSWTTASASFTIGQTNLNPGISQNCPTSVTGSASVISQIVLPNGQKLTFTYDPTYGMLSKMTYPTGGYVRYVWGLNSQAEAGIWASGLASWNCRYDFPAVTDRYVSFDGTTEVLHQHYAYTTSWSGSSANYASKSTTLTTYDLVRNANFRTIYTYAGVSSPCVPDQNPNTAGCLGNPTAQIPLEQTIQYYGTGANLLRTVTKSWFNSNTRTLGSELTTLDNGQSTLTVYCYNSSELETEHDDYDFGNAAPALPSCAAGVPSGTAAGPLLRRTVTTYSPSTTMSNYNVIDEPSKVQVYDSTGSNLAGETDYTYDNPVGATTSGIVQHSGGCNCGNLTAAARWLNSSSSTLTTNYTNDDTGQRLSMTDPRGNQTTYSYADDYSSGTPPGSTNAFLTQITHPNTGVGHIEKFSYAYATGELTGSTDQNNQVTNYEYNDSLARLTEADFPDGGQVATSYNDVPPVSIGSATKINSSTNLITTSIFDGLGHVTQTQLNSDPDGATYTDKTYDALGHVYCVSNPYRVSNPSNLGNFGFTDGITTTVYDALGRVTAVQPPDYWTATSPGGPTCPSLTTQTTPANPTNFVSTSYSGNCTTVTDEAGKARKSCSDGLGRLTQVTEDPGGLGYVTNYGYDALDNLTSVVQNGSRQRTFVYDSLSQLTSATNPESGTITYSYDANGNLTSKTSPAPNQTGSATVTANYSYDALNRLTQKSFSDGTTPAVKYGYDGIALTGCSVAPPTLADSNPIGRRTAMCDGAGAESWSHDSMGRILSDNRTTSGITKTVPYAYNLDGSLASLTYRQDRNPEPISYTPGGAGRPISAGNSSFGLAYSVHYAPNGSLCSLYSSWGQTFEHNYTFNNRLQVIDIQDWDQSWYAYDYGSSPPPCTAIADSYEEQLHLTYSYTDVSGHNNGDVQRINNNRDMARTQLFTYDSLNRLATAETLHQNQPWWQGDSPTAECWGEQFNYDPWGNLTGISPVSSAYTGCTQENWSMTATTKNQLQDTNNDYVGVYPALRGDAAGNLIQPGPLGGPYV